MKENKLSIKKTARYFSLGNLNEKTTHIWIVCHGYRQLAKYFIRNFNQLDPQHFIIAPEGLHRFYIDGYSGKVGASWMTSENRLEDINDYVNYLDQLMSQTKSQINHNPKIIVLGFSQGGATAARWVCQGISHVDSLILWSAVFPPDLNFELDANQLKDLHFEIVIGNEDEFINEETLTSNIKRLKQEKIPFHLTRFNGTHKIYQDVLIKIANKL